MSTSSSKQGMQDPELLVQRYHLRPTPELRELIFSQFQTSVERIARKYAGVEPQEDLVQVGYIGLLNALSKFDPDTGVRFSTYASHLIAGEIKHHLRDRAQIIRQPAWLQELRHKVNRTAVQLQAEYGRTPSVQEIATACGVSVNAVEEAFAAADLMKVASFDATLPGDEDSNELDNLAALDLDQLTVEERVVLEHAMDQLRDLEREVVTRFHFESMSQTEIANDLGISCNYVSHILRQSLTKLRRILTSEEASDRRLRKSDECMVPDTLDNTLGIYAERYFRDRLSEEVHRADATGDEVAILLLKFTGLEGFAGFYGVEAVGDFLVDASEHTRSMIRRLDVLCRYGRDGFAVILPFTGPTVDVVYRRMCEKFTPWLNNRRSPSGPVLLRSGYSVLGHNTKSAPELIAAAEAMMRGEFGTAAAELEAA